MSISIRQHELTAALVRLGAELSHVTEDKSRLEKDRSRSLLETSISLKRSLKESQQKVCQDAQKYVEDSELLHRRCINMQRQFADLEIRLLNLLSQQEIQENILRGFDYDCFPNRDLLPFFDANMLINTSFVCKRWSQRLKRFNAFGEFLNSSSLLSNASDPIPAPQEHAKLTLTICQLDRFSYIFSVESRLCSSCVSTARTNGDNARLVVSICEREPSSYLTELVFARNALSIDRCIQEINTDINAKKAALQAIRLRHENMLIEDRIAQMRIQCISKIVLDLKTQYASDSHTVMFLEKELASMRSELNSGLDIERSKQADLDSITEKNRQRQLRQAQQRNALLQNIAQLRKKINV